MDGARRTKDLVTSSVPFFLYLYYYSCTTMNLLPIIPIHSLEFSTPSPPRSTILPTYLLVAFVRSIQTPSWSNLAHKRFGAPSQSVDSTPHLLASSSVFCVHRKVIIPVIPQLNPENHLGAMQQLDNGCCKSIPFQGAYQSTSDGLSVIHFSFAPISSFFFCNSI